MMVCKVGRSRRDRRWNSNKTMSKPIQNNEEFILVAGIAEQDAYLAIVIRRIVARMIEIPVRELTSEMTFYEMIKRQSRYCDWDALSFFIEIEEFFQINFDSIKGSEIAVGLGYPNWFYNPDGYDDFAWIKNWFVHESTPKPQITVGQWIRVGVEVVRGSVSEVLVTPENWPGIKASDLESDAIAKKSPSHNALMITQWGCISVFAIFALVKLIFYLWKH